jgi:hypothetical protein
VSADKVDETKVVEPEAGDVTIMNKVLSLGFEFIVFSPIPPNS